jgi:hypothetical protein
MTQLLPAHAHLSLAQRTRRPRLVSCWSVLFVAGTVLSCSDDDDDGAEGGLTRQSQANMPSQMQQSPQQQQTVTLCSNTCLFAFDLECDDGGPGSFTGVCALGTDCSDCGITQL